MRISSLWLGDDIPVRVALMGWNLRLNQNNLKHARVIAKFVWLGTRAAN